MIELYRSKFQELQIFNLSIVRKLLFLYGECKLLGELIHEKEMISFCTVSFF
jgi:hypothetical protein